jgi:hypothetical protein
VSASTPFVASTPVPRSNGKPRIILPEHAPNADIARAVAKYANQRTAADKRLIEGTFDYYTRVSTLAKALDTGDGLVKWKAAMTLMGAAKSPTIVKAAKVLTDWHDAHELVEQACTLAGAGDKATEGTTLHKLTEVVDDPAGALPDGLDPSTLASLSAYENATAGLTPLAAEMFVVNDAIRCAGTFDRLYRVEAVDPWPAWLHGRVVVGDLKTGSYYPMPHAIQLAAYARGSLYDPADGARTPLGADQGVGLVMHLPQGEGRCDIYALDIAAGWTAAQAATWARDWNAAANRDAISHLVASVGAA